MNYLYCIAIGYLIGAFNPAYILAKIRGFDIRQKGSRNAGASNALILFGKAWGVVCAVLDIAKAYLAILLSESLFPDFFHAFAVTATACVLGHIFPFYMKFKGGKGLASLAGVILYFDWRVFLVLLGAEVVIALLTDYICFIPLTGAVAFTAVYGFLQLDIAGILMLLLMTGVIVWRHSENLGRIKQGTEMRLSYLWRPKEEEARIKKNLADHGEDPEKLDLPDRPGR